MNSYHHLSNNANQVAAQSSKSQTTALWPPPIVYGELSILGHNGQIHSSERSGRRNKSKFLLCKRPQPNGIKKSRHYIVKQPQEIQEKNLHSIAYTFSKSQTIVVEYKQDDHTDMFQVGRSSEDPIDFVVMDTHAHQSTSSSSKQYSSSSASNHHSHHNSNHNHQNIFQQSNNFHNHHQHHHNENASSSQHPSTRADMINSTSGGVYHHRHTGVKVGEEMVHYGYPGRVDNGSAVQLIYPPPMLANQYRLQDSSIFHHHQQAAMGHPSGSQQPGYLTSLGPSAMNGQHSSRHQRSSHTTQSTISRFACRILVDREPPYTARIYAAGFDSSKNIFLGEKATKWEQNNSIDGLTTNGVLIMKPKRGYFYEGLKERSHAEECDSTQQEGTKAHPATMDNGDTRSANGVEKEGSKLNISEVDADNDEDLNNISISEFNVSAANGRHETSETKPITSTPHKEYKRRSNDSNNNNNSSSKTSNNRTAEEPVFEYGGVWREVSVDGGIYAIRESRSAVQKGKRIENENNILQDGTLIDLCGATLLWRSLDGFRASPTKKSLEEKIDMLNTSRPQCPVGLNTLVIPKKPILPSAIHHHRKSGHHSSSHYNNNLDDKNIQPYIYPCGHVQGGHNWGATEKTNQRTCPICMSSGNVTKLSAGLEPSFYVDSGALTHAFTQCGHMASEKTVLYWSSTLIPHGTHFFHSICPFCATPLPTSEPPYTKLIFQGDMD